MRNAHFRPAALATALAFATLVSAGSAVAETTPPAVAAFTVTGPATVDTTYDWAAVNVRLRVTDAGSGVAGAQIISTYTRAATAYPASFPASGWTNPSGALTRVSGTAADGVYEGLAVANGGTRGTWSLKITAADRDGNTTTLTAAQIAAKGWRSSFASETTAPPAAPKITSNVIYPSFFYPHIGANLNFTQPAGTPFSNAAIRVSYTPACGTPSSSGPTATGDSYIDKRFAEQCTVVYRAVNAAGASPQATHAFR